VHFIDAKLAVRFLKRLYYLCQCIGAERINKLNLNLDRASGVRENGRDGPWPDPTALLSLFTLSLPSTSGMYDYTGSVQEMGLDPTRAYF